MWEISPSAPLTRWPNLKGSDEFYGPLGGSKNQWTPGVYHNLNRIETPDDPDYHFMNDMATHAINWIRFQQSLTPDKPFFTYLAFCGNMKLIWNRTWLSAAPSGCVEL